MKPTDSPLAGLIKFPIELLPGNDYVIAANGRLTLKTNLHNTRGNKKYDAGHRPEEDKTA